MSSPCAAGKNMAPFSSIWRLDCQWICFLIVKPPPWKRGSNNTQASCSAVATAQESLLGEPKRALQKRDIRLIASTSFATWQKSSRRCEGSHRQALKTIHLVTMPTSSPSPLLRHLRPAREQRKQQARAKLVERYEAVHRLLEQGRLDLSPLVLMIGIQFAKMLVVKSLYDLSLRVSGMPGMRGI